MVVVKGNACDQEVCLVTVLSSFFPIINTSRQGIFFFPPNGAPSEFNITDTLLQRIGLFGAPWGDTACTENTHSNMSF